MLELKDIQTPIIFTQIIYANSKDDLLDKYINELENILII